MWVSGYNLLNPFSAVCLYMISKWIQRNGKTTCWETVFQKLQAASITLKLYGRLKKDPNSNNSNRHANKEGGNVKGPQLWTQNYRQLKTAKKGRFSLSQDESLTDYPGSVASPAFTLSVNTCALVTEYSRNNGHPWRQNKADWTHWPLTLPSTGTVLLPIPSGSKLVAYH